MWKTMEHMGQATRSAPKNTPQHAKLAPEIVESGKKFLASADINTTKKTNEKRTTRTWREIVGMIC